MCRNASVHRIRSFLREHGDELDSHNNKKAENPLTEAASNKSLPEISMEDLMNSLQVSLFRASLYF